MSELQKTLEVLKKNSRRIGSAGMRAALNVLQEAGRAAAQGHIAKEIGSRFVRGGGEIIQGRVGLQVNTKVQNPHGRFLAAGTKFIKPDHFLKKAFESSLGAAEEAMAQGCQDKLEQFL